MYKTRPLSEDDDDLREALRYFKSPMEELDWKSMDLSEEELAFIKYKTEIFIWKTTEDRVSGPYYSDPYWIHRMKWVSLLMDGRFSENETKNKMICTVRGHPFTFDFIITSGLYKYCVCIFEIDRWMKESALKGKHYDIPYVLHLRKVASQNGIHTLSKEEQGVLNKVFYDGTSILNCFSDYFRIFKKRGNSQVKGGSNKRRTIRRKNKNTRRRL
jgi:hypothetical protein